MIDLTGQLGARPDGINHVPDGFTSGHLVYWTYVLWNVFALPIYVWIFVFWMELFTYLKWMRV